MNWSQGLKQGMLGRAQQTLDPTTIALGRNTYLTEQHFLRMVAVALLLHGLVLGIASLWPDERVTDIPVRALTFKIGATQRIAAFAPVAAPVPVAPAASQWRAAPATAKPVPQPVKQPKIIPLVPRDQRQVPTENAQPTPQPQSVPQPVQQAPSQNPPQAAGLPDTGVLMQQAAIAPNPQRFIRETGSPAGAVGGQGSATTLPADTVQQVRERYEQVISGWIQQHYPNIAPGARKLRPVVRLRIDRTGNLRYYALEQSSGSDAVDAAALDMIRRANPLPPVPPAYPAGNLVEFLIPIVFRVP